MARIVRALVSVSDKTGVVQFAQGLRALGVEILSTGGTARALAEAGVAVVSVSAHTGAPEILDGRVKTLHPRIHGGLLGRRDDPRHRDQMAAHGIVPIDMVVVNLYPFEATVARPGCTVEEAIEQIDIGGPAMVRSAAKNHRDVTVIVDPADYGAVLDEMRAGGGTVSAATNARLACKAFALTARYDGAIADYLGSLRDGDRSRFGATVHLGYDKALALRYGENPHQQAALYGTFPAAAEVLHGKELSYNNVVDIDAAVALMLDVGDGSGAAVAILKHNTPCGVATGATPVEAWRRAFESDPESPFGGIVITNRPWDLPLAREVDEIFTEVLVAPDFTPEALGFLCRKRQRRLVRWRPEVAAASRGVHVRGVLGGLLVQDADTAVEDPRAGQVVTRRAPTEEEFAAMAFGVRVVKHVKSNAVAFVAPGRTLALGGGATSRVDAVHAARDKAARVGVSLQGSVLASDAFFPFPDGVEVAARAGAAAIVQPGGSVRDAEVVAAADRLGLAMVFTGVRHFRH